MKKITQYLISIFFVIFLINNAFGFAGIATDNSTAQPESEETTESDQDIILLQHLIEVDTVQMQSENKLLVRETLIFKNAGAKNFSGSLRTWVPDGADGIRVGRIEMTMGAAPRVVGQLQQNGNIISWKDEDYIKSNDPLPPLYVVEYLLPAGPEGTLVKSKRYSKVLLYPTLTKQPVSFVLRVTKSKEESVTITDEKGSSISASGNPNEQDSSILYGWEMPEFKELNIEISKPAVTPAGIAGYAILGLVIILVLSYPIIRKKSEKLQVLEEKIRSALKREPEEIEEVEEVAEGAGETAEETISEPGEMVEAAQAEEAAEFEGKTREELENLKAEVVSKLGELDKEYESGNMLDEEYEELRKSYSEKAELITKKMETL